ncbi:hypothetical protein PMAYCL1PPCAC_23706 [Pristionchus mayeri]|uniref:Uncharacterized protein n=1 Tax=Pristionchus mayeri TaxID=1317129 RepID=A0AAN5CYQ2_9BILA|nr:hypothetical protein PMAYCL1PPCAC_23706 [Pristionchus mayeri]
MLSHLYSYVFGSENVEDCSSSVCMRTRTKEDNGGWLIVNESGSGRSSPILIAPPQLIELDELSCHSIAIPSSAMRRAEELREAKAAKRMRTNLERAMFSDPPEKTMEVKGETKTTTKMTGSKLKRASVSSLVASEGKKSRSKKGAKLLAGANNNRKCNNLA